MNVLARISILISFLFTILFVAFPVFTQSFEVIGSEILSIDDRIFYQTAIEKIYWQNRSWPKENTQKKPSFSEAVPEEVIKTRVMDSLRKSAALEKYWGTSLGAKELQTEMNRMARATKQPETLRKLWEALGNNPAIIAEIFARSVLSDRLIRTGYAFDARFHGDFKAIASSEIQQLNEISDLRSLSGRYFELHWKSKLSNNNVSQELEMDEKEWNSKTSDLERLLKNRISKKTAIEISDLQEDENRFYVIGVLERDADHVRLVVVEWKKIPFDEWWRKIRQGISMSIPTIGQYEFPEISNGGSCQTEHWDFISGPPEARFDHTAVWTGTEMIIWGGDYFAEEEISGARYNPITDTWEHISQVNAPSARRSYSMIWTGSEVIFWGGYKSNQKQVPLLTGARYNPITDTWTPTSNLNAPLARYGHTAFWTGSEMIIWGGRSPSKVFRTGAKYNPSTDQWLSINNQGAPAKRSRHAAVQVENWMLIWGGAGRNQYGLNTGGKYNWITDTWEPIANSGSTFGVDIMVVSTDTEMIVWPGEKGARYNLTTDTWTLMSTLNEPEGRRFHSLIWTGSEMIVWGGRGGSLGEPYPLNDGGRYDPQADTWEVISTLNAPSHREEHSAIWTGNEMIIWGGSTVGDDQIGGRYNPTTDSWLPTGVNNAPSPRTHHSSIWTGNEMIVWGGDGDFGPMLATGSKYDPSIDAWNPTTDSPRALNHHAAIWTGSEMIACCGSDENDFSPVSVRYNPSTDLWLETSDANAPFGRTLPTAVWTGTEAIFWGGAQPGTDTGGKYNPFTDSWQPTSLFNAPESRRFHTAIWDGAEMIIFGGGDFFNLLNTGGRYDPVSDTWLDLSLTNAPTGRIQHTAVWTGSEMIIWGGYDGSGFVNSGARYIPSSQTWQTISNDNSPTPPEFPPPHGCQRAVWTGSEMIAAGGSSEQGSAGRFNPNMNVWKGSLEPNLVWPVFITAVWTDAGMTVWGGGLGRTTNLGSRYCPSYIAFPFIDDFEDGDVSDWNSDKGTWTGVNGNLTGNYTGIANIISPYGGCYLCTVETDMMIQTNGGSASIFAWYRDEKNNVELQMNADKDNWIVKHKLNGQVVSKMDVNQQIDPNVNYHIKLNFNGTQLNVTVDEINILNLLDSSIPAGTVGFRIKSKPGNPVNASFQQILVY